MLDWWYILENYPTLYAVLIWFCAWGSTVYGSGLALSLTAVGFAKGLNARRIGVCVLWPLAATGILGAIAVQLAQGKGDLLPSSSSPDVKLLK